MSRNYAELEQELIADLQVRTGRDLAQWMDAIKTAGLVDKNAIIDWLRPQGFTFANASWLERIHNNGGRAIYGDAHLARRGPPGQTASTQRSVVHPPLTEPSPGAMAAVAATASSVRMPAGAKPELPPLSARISDPDQIKQVLARGKAFRPLAELLVSEIKRASPNVMISAVDDMLVFARPLAFAALLITPRELRLGLDLAGRAFDAVVIKARLPGGDPRWTHMMILNDARQVGPPLLDLISQSQARVNSPAGR